MEQIRKSFLKYLVLISFITYYSGATMFYHAHIQGDGKIVHSHFYLTGDASAPSHSHSNSSLSLLALLLSSLNFIVSSLLLQSVYNQIQSIISISDQRKPSLYFNLQIQSRAPPAVS